eukprot:11104_1
MPTVWLPVLIASILYATLTVCIDDQVDYDWIILRKSTDMYNKDWNHINRKWHKIKYIHTDNGHNIKRKCSTYSNGKTLCLCQYLSHLTHNIQHICLNRNPQSVVPTLPIMDSFSSSQYNEGDHKIASAIRNGMHYYYQRYMTHQDLPIDSLFLLKLIAKNDAEYTNIANAYYQTVRMDDPFCRIFSRSSDITQRFSDLNIVRRHEYQQRTHGVHNLYILNSKYRQFYKDPTDDVVLKALFCDIKGYDAIDFDILMDMARSDGGYYDTHSIIALRLLAVNQCYDKYQIHYAMTRVAKSILMSLHRRRVLNFGDLFFEQIVCLYWAGFGDYIKPKWIVDIARHQSIIDYGWSHDYTRKGKHLVPIDESASHPTGLAIVAMVYYEIGESKQSLYPVNVLKLPQ